MMSSPRLLQRRANFRRNSTFLAKSVKDEYHPTETGNVLKSKHKIKPSQHITEKLYNCITAQNSALSDHVKC